MPYDLRTAPWIPFRRRSGEIAYLPPWQITDQIGTNPIVALAAPRPDFNGALHEFLIGLFTVALNLTTEDAWESAARTPPSPETLKDRLLALPDAFNLDGDGPRFLQDFSSQDFDDVKSGPIEGLLIDAAGENTQKLNKDLFVKRGRVGKLGLAGAAMALLTLQTYAPSGGQGHRTSMRGGGPLTTLVDPRADGRRKDTADREPLWTMIAANLLVLSGKSQIPTQWNSDSARLVATRIWPWLAPTSTSNDKQGGKIVYPADAHPLQVFFGMPRRIRLDIEDRETQCDVLAHVSSVTVPTYRTLNFGMNYGSGLWVHPLSPHYFTPKKEKLPLHPQPDGIGWKDWAGVVLNQMNDKSGVAQQVAEVVENYRRMAWQGEGFAVRVFGYDMDNMKARGWADATLPAWPVGTSGAATFKAISNGASQLVEAARLVGNLCVGAVLSALFERKEEAKGDFSHIKAEVWALMEEAFYQRIESGIAKAITSATDMIQHKGESGQDYLGELRTTAFDVFDAYVDLTAMDVLDAHRVVLARRDFGAALSGYGKAGNALFASLALPMPDKGSKAKPNAKKEKAQ